MSVPKPYYVTSNDSPKASTWRRGGRSAIFKEAKLSKERSYEHAASDKVELNFSNFSPLPGSEATVGLWAR